MPRYPYRIITGGGIGILPRDIDASKHLWNAFDHSETEISAGWIIRMAQERGAGWEPFKREQIAEFYGRVHQDGFSFNKLLSSGWIIQDTDGNFHFTDDFVRRAYASSPMPKKETNE